MPNMIPLPPARIELIDWYEHESMREWSLTSLPHIPSPPFRSSERDGLKRRLANKYARFMELEAELNLVRKEIVQDLAVLSPIRLAPPEIMAQIFEEVALTFELDTQDQKRSVQKGPSLSLVNSHVLSVCRKWQQLLLNTPSFWSVFNISFRSGIRSDNGIKQLKQHLQMSLARSGGSPITIRFNSSVFLHRKHASYIASMFIQHFSRCTLLVDSTGGKFLKTMALKVPGPLQLVTLTLMNVSQRMGQISESGSLTLPRLQWLRIEGMGLMHIPTLYCPNLVFLSLNGDWDQSNFRTLLRRLPSLRELELREHWRDNERWSCRERFSQSTSVSSSIEAPFLRNLVLIGHLSIGLGLLLGSNNITDLWINIPLTLEDERIPKFLGLFSVTHLTLICHLFKFRDAKQWFRNWFNCVPQLRSLKMMARNPNQGYNAPGGNATPVIEILCETDVKGDILCPLLTEVVIQRQYINPHKLLEFSRHRASLIHLSPSNGTLVVSSQGTVTTKSCVYCLPGGDTFQNVFPYLCLPNWHSITYGEFAESLKQHMLIPKDVPGGPKMVVYVPQSTPTVSDSD